MTKFKIEVVYLGERADKLFGQINQVFRDKKGKLYHFRGIKNIWVGDSYKVSIDGKIQVRPARVEKQKVFMTDQEKLDYEAHKEICKQIRLEKKKAMEIKKPHPDISKAIDLLRPFARNLGVTDLHRFVKYLENQISKPKRKK